MMPFDWFQRFIEQSVKQAAAGVVTNGEASLQPVAQGHELIDLGNDAVLLGERWKRKQISCEAFACEMFNARSSEILDQTSIICTGSKRLHKKSAIYDIQETDAMNCFLKINVVFAPVPYRRSTGLASLAYQHIAQSERELWKLRILKPHLQKV